MTQSSKPKIRKIFAAAVSIALIASVLGIIVILTANPTNPTPTDHLSSPSSTDSPSSSTTPPPSNQYDIRVLVADSVTIGQGAQLRIPVSLYPLDAPNYMSYTQNARLTVNSSSSNVKCSIIGWTEGPPTGFNTQVNIDVPVSVPTGNYPIVFTATYQGQQHSATCNVLVVK